MPFKHQAFKGCSKSQGLDLRQLNTSHKNMTIKMTDGMVFWVTFHTSLQRIAINSSSLCQVGNPATLLWQQRWKLEECFKSWPLTQFHNGSVKPGDTTMTRWKNRIWSLTCWRIPWLRWPARQPGILQWSWCFWMRPHELRWWWGRWPGSHVAGVRYPQLASWSHQQIQSWWHPHVAHCTDN